jgi:ABC-type lipoprotein release transport system permease subunit
MSSWEKFAKHMTKGFLWAVAYLILATSLELTPSWQLLTFVVVLGLWGSILDALIPTTTPATIG